MMKTSMKMSYSRMNMSNISCDSGLGLPTQTNSKLIMLLLLSTYNAYFGHIQNLYYIYEQGEIKSQLLLYRYLRYSDQSTYEE